MRERKRVSSCTQIMKKLVSLYNNSPITLSAFTGLHYLGIPHLRGNILMGRLSQVGDKLGDEILCAGQLAIEHPSGMCFEYIGPTKIVLLITKPEHIHQVMQYDRKGEIIRKKPILKAFSHVFGDNIFSSEGAEWKSQRKMYKSYFIAKPSLKKLVPEMQMAINSHIETEQNPIYTVELTKFCIDLAMNVIAITRMGTGILSRDSLQELQLELAKAMREVSDYRNDVKIKMSEKLHYLSFTGATTKAKSDLHRQFIKHITNETHTDHILQTDNLLRMTAASTANKIPEEVAAEDLQSERTLCDGSFLLLAGHETTSKLIQFVLMTLSVRPDILQQIEDELVAVDMSAMTLDDIKNQLPYLNKVLNEALRLYPPVPVFAREVMQDFMIDDIPVRKGTVVMVAPLVTHQREDVAGPNPKIFNPNRWNEAENPNLYAPSAFIPFGDGARACVGKDFAFLEAAIAITTLVNKFNFRLQTKPGQNSEYLFETRFEGTLKPAHDVPMTFTNKRSTPNL